MFKTSSFTRELVNSVQTSKEFSKFFTSTNPIVKKSESCLITLLIVATEPKPLLTKKQISNRPKWWKQKGKKTIFHRNTKKHSETIIFMLCAVEVPPLLLGKHCIQISFLCWLTQSRNSPNMF